MTQIKIGWGDADLTPAESVQITGQFHLRMSEGVLDPITATALALDSGDGHIILISCDLVGIPPTLQRTVRNTIAEQIPELTPTDIVLNATHTHAGPEVRLQADFPHMGNAASCMGNCVDVPGMSPEDYVAMAADRIATAAIHAWQTRGPGKLAYGLGQAVVGRNRLSCYSDGVSRMYGPTHSDTFTHIEGYEDHDVNLIATWDADDQLTGLLVNIACPSQETEQLFQLSADFWSETRAALRYRHGKDLHILTQCSAAGDQSPHIQVNKSAEARMRKLAGRSERQEIAARICEAVATTLPIIARDRHSDVAVAHRTETLAVPRSRLTQADVDKADEQADALLPEIEAQQKLLDEHPEKRLEKRWYVPLTKAYRKRVWYQGVAKRFASEQDFPTLDAELHVIKIGPLVIATNPHEYYLDYGIRIKARSAAQQTLVVQLTGWGTYVPSQRALAGGSYGAMPASNPIGPEGGHMMCEWSINTIQELVDA